MNFRDPRTPLTPEQAELRRLVLKQVEADPDGFSMAGWEDVPRIGRHCGTTRCLCGWAEFFAYGEVRDATNFQHRATGIRLLGLTYEEYCGDYADAGLFYLHDSLALRRMREITPGHELHRTSPLPAGSRQLAGCAGRAVA